MLCYVIFIPPDADPNAYPPTHTPNSTAFVQRERWHTAKYSQHARAHAYDTYNEMWLNAHKCN